MSDDSHPPPPQAEPPVASGSQPDSSLPPPPPSSSVHNPDVQVLPPPTAPIANRSQLLERARTFLHSPQVQHEDTAAKYRFLQEKGLNDVEIRGLLQELVRPLMHTLIAVIELRLACAYACCSTSDVSPTTAVQLTWTVYWTCEDSQLGHWWISGYTTHLLCTSHRTPCYR